VNSGASLLGKVGRFAADLGRRGIVVAVSGGPDSVALLRALIAVRTRTAPRPLVVAHLNHLLRGAESDGDEAFVRQLHASLTAAGVPALELRCDRIDVAAQARAEAGNVENVARRLRYDWLANVAADTGCRWIATGHTADDQAETVLHRLLRGAGIQGLRGIAARRAVNGDIEIVRPLLDVTRAELLAYLAAEKQEYRQDSSNLNLALTRNRLRHELLPLLARDYNPSIVGLLGQLAEQAEELYRAMEADVGRLLAEVELPPADGLLILERRKLSQAPRHLIRELFRQLWSRQGWPQSDMDYAAWDRLAGVALGELPAVDLPGGIRIRARERVVQVGPSE
jgi:tRNA(Ile)-lysidine synthase